MDTPKRREKLRLHGEPSASRVLIPTTQTDTSEHFGWVTQCLARDLKTKFLDELSTRARATRFGERLVVIIVGHGGKGGGVGISEHRRVQWGRCLRLLQPSEVLRIVMDSQGAVTVVVNTCHSGCWNEAAVVLGLANYDSNITILARECRQCYKNKDYRAWDPDCRNRGRYEDTDNYIKSLKPYTRAEHPCNNDIWHSIGPRAAIKVDLPTLQRGLIHRASAKIWESVVKRYLSLPIPEGNAGYNVHLSVRLHWDYLKSLNCEEYFELEQLQIVLTPWTDVRRGLTKLLILTDSIASKHALSNLGRGALPRSGIEREIKGLPHKRAHRETAIGWVRSHIGIPGNEKADKKAAYESALGRIAGSQQVATYRSGYQGRGQSKTEVHAFRTRVWSQQVPMVQARPVRLHLAAHQPGPTELLASPHPQGRLPSLRQLRSPLGGRLPYHLRLPSPPSATPGVHRRCQDMGRFGHTNLEEEEGEQEWWDAVEAYFAYLYRPLAGR
ncbi:hypothetical protein EV426DRAFT_712170 [Tirmania nivea]|nr:hypothetical protein EV426DRAFT_712170 [Tirmania nivea]